MLKQIDATTLYSAVRLTVRFSEYGEVRPSAGSGTGFVVGEGTGPDEHLYLVTNRHVVDADYEKRRGWTLTDVRITGFYQSSRDFQSPPVRQEVVLASPEFCFPSAWHVDLAVLPLITDRTEVVSGRGRFNVLPASMLALRHDFRSGDVTVGRQVLMPGYPGIGDQLADRPILVGGVIATDPRFPAVLGSKEYPDEALCHAFSWKGMSGSPVLCAVPRPVTWNDFDSKGAMGTQYVLAGVNAGHIEARSDAAAGAISRFVKGDVLADLLRQAGADIFELPGE
ncbi:serine protease [Streptomyces sp. NBC_01450]|uniref:S1 family peptidase n=1 Tax=Streptomyces sp. NBC_01450 TaxID=2903871 RepID=UPI002E2EAF53|nr:trypsin-like peptidase domain-containing protein [Streptomyces sp. NBC_01450]